MGGRVGIVGVWGGRGGGGVVMEKTKNFNSWGGGGGGLAFKLLSSFLFEP